MPNLDRKSVGFGCQVDEVSLFLQIVSSQFSTLIQWLIAVLLCRGITITVHRSFAVIGLRSSLTKDRRRKIFLSTAALQQTVRSLPPCISPFSENYTV